MKKTLITLLALAGVAAAAETLTAENATGWVYATGDSYTDWGLGSLSVSANAEGDLTFTGDIATAILPAGGAKQRTVTVIALTLDLAKLDLPEATSRMLTLNGSDSGGNITGLGVNAEGNMTGTWTNNAAYLTSGASLVGTTERSFVYVLGTGNGTQAAGGTQIYADSASDASVWSSSGLKGDLGNISTMTLESWAVDALVSMVVWSGTEAYGNKELAAQAFAANQSLPEPTTATLSLLALAGLAARRRRK